MRATDRLRKPGRNQASQSVLDPTSNPVLELQRSAGNRAVAQVIARAPAATSTVEIAGVGKIKVTGGNLKDWTGKESFDTVDVTSEKGKHSTKLEKLATARTRTNVTVMIVAPGQAGEDLNVGGGTQLEIEGARIKYTVQDGVETWQIVNFTNVKRTKISHKIGSN